MLAPHAQHGTEHAPESATRAYGFPPGSRMHRLRVDRWLTTGLVFTWSDRLDRPPPPSGARGGSTLFASTIRGCGRGAKDPGNAVRRPQPADRCPSARNV